MDFNPRTLTVSFGLTVKVQAMDAVNERSIQVLKCVFVCLYFEWVRGWLTLTLCPSYNDTQVYKRQFKSAMEIVSVCQWVMNSCYTFASIALCGNLWPLHFPPPPSTFQCILGFVLCSSRPKGDMWALQRGKGLPWLCKWQKTLCTLFFFTCLLETHVNSLRILAVRCVKGECLSGTWGQDFLRCHKTEIKINQVRAYFL